MPGSWNVAVHVLTGRRLQRVKKYDNIEKEPGYQRNLLKAKPESFGSEISFGTILQIIHIL